MEAGDDNIPQEDDAPQEDNTPQDAPPSQIEDEDYLIAEQLEEERDGMEEDDIPNASEDIPDAPIRKPRGKRIVEKDCYSQEYSQKSHDIYDDKFIVDKLPVERSKLQGLLSEVKSKVKEYQLLFLQEEKKAVFSKSFVGDHAVPICADVKTFDFDRLMEKQMEIAGRSFDVIMMDPPWRLSSSQPSRGVAIQYSTLGDQAIERIPVCKLQRKGLLFVWVINAKFQFTVNTMEKKWGYKVVDSINWVKKTVNGRIAKGHGFYLQHAKETCLVGCKGDFTGEGNVASDVIFSYRRGQSQKPTQIYEYIEKLVPDGYYLEIFGRRNNLRDRWTTIGNEL